MKKLLLLIAIIAGTSLFAQDLSYGLKAGLAYGGGKTTDADYNSLFKPTVAFTIGAFAEFKFSDQFAVRPELNFLQTSFKGTAENVNVNYFETLLGGPFAVNNEKTGSRSYLNIPVLLEYYVMDGLSINAGPYISFLMSAKNDGKFLAYVPTDAYEQAFIALGYDLDGELNDWVTLSVSDNEDVKDEYKSTDIGLALGATYNLENGMFVDVRYNLGFNDQNDDPDAVGTASGDLYGQADYAIHNRIAQFTIGYRF